MKKVYIKDMEGEDTFIVDEKKTEWIDSVYRSVAVGIMLGAKFVKGSFTDEQRKARVEDAVKQLLEKYKIN